MNDRALKILEQYDLEIISTRRGRGSYICETTQGLRILSDYAGSENKALFQNFVMKQIRDGGYQRVDLIVPDKEGKLTARDWEENRYVVKEWYTGRECDTSSESEILLAVENLARLHKLMCLPPDSGFQSSFSAQPPRTEAARKNTQLRKIRSFIRKKNDKCEFERLFLNCFARYYEQAQEAETKLLSMENTCSPVNTVCHGDYNHHHVLICGYEMATTNFDNCRFDYQISDLYRFMRKILEKHDWNPRLGMHMLERYIQEKPVSAAERRLLYVKMLYPDKFYKLANQYYGSKKAWVSGRFQEKLEQQNRQQKMREQFVRLLE